MSKLILVLALAALGVFGAYHFLNGEPAPPPDASEAAGAAVAAFGAQLKMVPLSGEPGSITQAMDQYYAPYVTRDLLTQWKTDPTLAPGRLTSSPWPDRIEIVNVVANADASYTVTGTVVEVTSADGPTGISNAYEVTARVEQEGSAWRISAFTRAL